MDGRGRLAEPVTDAAHPAGEAPAPGRPIARGATGSPRRRSRRRRARTFRPPAVLRRAFAPLANCHLPRGAGIAAAALLMLASVLYGAVRGEHLPALAGDL